MEDVYKSMCICGNFIYKDNILNHCNCADKFRRDSAQTISELESDRQAWKDNCSDQDEIINELEERNKRLKDDYDIHIKALALRADKIEELKNEYEKLKDLSIDMANSIKFHVCNRDLLDRLEELLTKKDGK